MERSFRLLVWRFLPIHIYGLLVLLPLMSFWTLFNFIDQSFILVRSRLGLGKSSAKEELWLGRFIVLNPSQKGCSREEYH